MDRPSLHIQGVFNANKQKHKKHKKMRKKKDFHRLYIFMSMGIGHTCHIQGCKWKAEYMDGRMILRRAPRQTGLMDGWVNGLMRSRALFSHLQASLFSLPLSVLPDWLEFLEPFSAFVSCCWCSGRRSRAFRRQMAANSMLATGMAADWPSLCR